MAPMSLLVLDDARHVGLTAAELVANRIRARPRLRVLLPTGHTPRGLYAALRHYAADGSLPQRRDDGARPRRRRPAKLPRRPRSRARWHPDRPSRGTRRCRRRPDAEAARYEAVLDTAPVDLAVLGLGRDAHVAFNEPGSRPGDGVRRVALDPSTIAAAAADFGGAARVPREALTTGLRTLRAARELLLIVTGPRPSRWRASGHWPMCRSCSRSRAARPPRTPRGRCPRRGHPRQRRDLAVARARPVLLAPYRAFGLDVDSRPARPLRGWAHLLAEELGGVAGMPRQRRAAMDAVRLPEGL